MKLEWKNIKGYPGYQVSNNGRIRNSNGLTQPDPKNPSVWKNLKSYQRQRKYLAIDLYLDGKRVTHFIHQLVAKTFFRAKGGCETVEHRDKNRSNNCISNLEWMTRSDNTAKARADILGSSGGVSS